MQIDIYYDMDADATHVGGYVLYGAVVILSTAIHALP
jgi:hypothetical protein